jgi:hypothetical protein
LGLCVYERSWNESGDCFFRAVWDHFVLIGIFCGFKEKLMVLMFEVVFVIGV